MSKYSPLTDHLSKNGSSLISMRFAEIERVIGRPLPPSSREHRAWWSNNPSNNVMTKAWLAAGYETEQVDISGEKLVFRKQSYRAPPPSGPARNIEAEHPLLGCYRGQITFSPGYDPTEPTGGDWNVLADGDR